MYTYLPWNWSALVSTSTCDASHFFYHHLQLKIHSSVCSRLRNILPTKVKRDVSTSSSLLLGKCLMCAVGTMAWRDKRRIQKCNQFSCFVSLLCHLEIVDQIYFQYAQRDAAAIEAVVGVSFVTIEEKKRNWLMTFGRTCNTLAPHTK